jgi:GNAT superfamily N-acetyltransferase
MDDREGIVRTPWDAELFGFDTYELTRLSEDLLDQTVALPGHFTIKVDPLASKKLLHEYGFYYCDTLIEPYCRLEWFIYSSHDKIGLAQRVSLEELAPIVPGAFRNGRFHRDFYIEQRLADARYAKWLQALHDAGNCLGLMYENRTAGFFCFDRQRIVLHALDERYRGRGLSRYFWSAACRELFNREHAELVSSISASNMAALNLYGSLGFRFRNARDVYHCYHPKS